MHFPFFKFASNARWESEKPHSFAGFDSHGQDTRPGEREIETLWKAATSAPSPLPSYAPASLQWRPLNVQRFSLKLNANAEREEKELSLQQQEEQDALLPLPQLSLPPPSCCCMCCINCNTNCRACCSLSVYLCVSHRYICRCCWMRNVVVAQAHGTRHEGQHVGLDNILCSQTGRGTAAAAAKLHVLSLVVDPN